MKFRFWNKNPTAVEKYPVVPAKKLIPSWFKKLPNMVEYYNNHGTIKTCPGIVNYLRSGFILRSWLDTIIETTDSYIKFSYPNGEAPPNYLSTMDAMTFNKDVKEYKEYSHPVVIKWDLGWYCQAPKGYNLMFAPTQYHPNLNFTTAMGITDTRIEESLNSPAAWHPTEQFVFIPAGTPVLQVIPFKREEYDYDVVCAKEKDIKREFIKQTRWLQKKCSYFNEEYFDDSVDEIFNEVFTDE